MTKFQELGLNENILKGINDLGYEEAFPIQEAVIPVLLAGRDVVGQAHTGSGKTAAFALAMLQKIQLEQEVFDSCLINGKYLEEIKKDLGDGRDYGVSGTPGFFIGNDQLGYVELKGAQPFDSFKKVIDAQLDA